MPRKKLCIIGVDPGKTTGIAMWTRVSFTTMEVRQDEVEPYLEACLKMMDYTNVDVFIGVQRFAILPGTHKKTRQPAASEIVGVVRNLGEKYQVLVDVQSASTAARFKNDTLRKLGWYTITRGGHANDAARHVCVTLLTYRPEEMARLLEDGTIDS